MSAMDGLFYTKVGAERFVRSALVTPRTDDMRAMLSDLHDAGACPINWHDRIGLSEMWSQVAGASRFAATRFAAQSARLEASVVPES